MWMATRRQDLQTSRFNWRVVHDPASCVRNCEDETVDITILVITPFYATTVQDSCTARRRPVTSPVQLIGNSSKFGNGSLRKDYDVHIRKPHTKAEADADNGERWAYLKDVSNTCAKSQMFAL